MAVDHVLSGAVTSSKGTIDELVKAQNDSTRTTAPDEFVLSRDIRNFKVLRKWIAGSQR